MKTPRILSVGDIRKIVADPNLRDDCEFEILLLSEGGPQGVIVTESPAFEGETHFTNTKKRYTDESRTRSTERVYRVTLFGAVDHRPTSIRLPPTHTEREEWRKRLTGMEPDVFFRTGGGRTTAHRDNHLVGV